MATSAATLSRSSWSTGGPAIDFYALVADWARWAHAIVDTWPDDPRQAVGDESLIRDNVERADAAASVHDPAQA
jgi:hypothetical protein